MKLYLQFPRSANITRLLLLCLTLGSSAVAQTQPESIAKVDPSAPAVSTQKPDQKDEEVILLGEFNVTATGTNIRGVEPTGTAVQGLSRNDILQVGALSTASLINSNPSMSGFQSQYRGNGDAGGSVAPSIHGLGEGETLVLINGHRLPGSGYLVTAADPTAISPAAIQNIDIIPDGSSAVYGSDAVEGVINIILRQDFKGEELSARFGYADAYKTYNLGALVGNTFSKGSFLVAYEYQHQDALAGHDRDYFRENRTAVGGSDARGTRTGVVTDANGATVNVGQLVDLATYFDILPKTDRHNVVGQVTYKATDNLSLNFDTYMESRKATWKVPSSTVTSTIAANDSRVPVADQAAASPLSVTYLPGVVEDSSKANVYSVTGGGTVKLPNEWALHLDSTYGWSNSKTLFPDINSAYAQSDVTAGTLNPFSPSVLSNMELASINNIDVDQSLWDTTLKADGSLFALPGGSAKAAFGAAHRDEGYKGTNDIGSYSSPTDATVGPLHGRADVKRHVGSAFGEVYFPLVGKDNAVTGIQKLNLSLSARYDHYSDFGGTTNPKIGLTWTVFQGLNLRSSWGTSFHAPRLSDIGTGIDTRLIDANWLTQYLSFPSSIFPTKPKTALIIAGGTVGLKPERAQSWSAGFDFKPKFLEGLKVSATFYNVVFKDNVDVVFAPDFNNPSQNKFWMTNVSINDPRLAGIPHIPGTTYSTTYDYVGDVRRYNLGTKWTNGVDLDISYAWTVGDNNFETGVAGNYLTRFRTQTTTGATVSDMLGIVNGSNNGIRNKLRGHVSWHWTQYNAAVFVNRTDNYINAGSGHPVNPNATIDLHFSYDIAVKSGLLSGTSLALDVTNILDKDPPYYNVGSDNRSNAGNGAYGYDNTTASPIGRMISLSVTKKF